MKPDPLGLRGQTFHTSGAAMGRIATRASPSATTSLAADAAREIDEALAASGVIETDDNLHSIAKELGYSAREAELAIIAGLRLGLFSVEE